MANKKSKKGKIVQMLFGSKTNQEEQNNEIHEPGYEESADLSYSHEEPENKKKRNNNNTVSRICCVCLKPFKASRRDAKTCSTGCRNSASENGVDYGKSLDFPQFLVFEELQARFAELIERDGTDVYLHELETWMKHSWKVKEMLFPYIDSYNYHRNLYLNILDGFYEYLQQEYSGYQNNPFRYNIPIKYYSEMYIYLGSVSD